MCHKCASFFVCILCVTHTMHLLQSLTDRSACCVNLPCAIGLFPRLQLHDQSRGHAAAGCGVRRGRAFALLRAALWVGLFVESIGVICFLPAEYPVILSKTITQGDHYYLFSSRWFSSIFVCIIVQCNNFHLRLDSPVATAPKGYSLETIVRVPINAELGRRKKEKSHYKLQGCRSDTTMRTAVQLHAL